MPPVDGNDDTLIERICIPAETTIFEAVKVLEATHRRVVLVVDQQNKLLGVVTDQDIRRAILRQVNFNCQILEIATRHPIVTQSLKFDSTIVRLMRQRHCYQIPVIDEGGRLQGIHFFEDYADSASEPETAIIMAGGLGSRLKPLTNNTPKPLIEVGGRPILFTILDRLIEGGFGNIHITINYLGSMIKDAIQNVSEYRDAVKFIEEPSKLGTAGSISLLPNRPTRSFLVMNADLLTKVSFRGMLDFHRYEGNIITMAVKQEEFTVPYGVAELDGTRVRSLREKPKFNFFLNAGLYVVEPKVIDEIQPNTTLDMPEFINHILSRNDRVGCFPVHEYWMDIGRPEQLTRANDEYEDTFLQPQ